MLMQRRKNIAAGMKSLVGGENFADEAENSLNGIEFFSLFW